MDFTVLHDTIDNKEDKFTAKHYNEVTCSASGNRVLDDFTEVYTAEGYELACKMRRAKDWLYWFTIVRSLGAVRYKQVVSVYLEDGATVPECDIKAYDKDGKELLYKQLLKTYIGYSDINHNKRKKEWENELPNYFNSILKDIVTYQEYLVWKEENDI